MTKGENRKLSGKVVHVSPDGLWAAASTFYGISGGPRLFWVFSSMASACVGSQGRYGYIQVKDHRRPNDDVHFRMDVVRDSGGLSLAFGDRVEFWIQPQGEGWRPTAAAAPWLASICIFHDFLCLRGNHMYTTSAFFWIWLWLTRSSS